MLMPALLTNKWVLKGIAGAMLVAIITAAVVAIYNTGYDHADTKGQLRFEQFKLEMTQRVAVLNQQIAEAEAQIVVKYVDRIQTVNETRVVFRDRIEYVPSSCELSQGWVNVHDSAIRAERVSIEDAGQSGQSGVTDIQALQIVTDNYLTCEQTRQQLMSLQRWVREISEVVND
jgi:hypothetical protein